jgi:hypothetical protein
MVYGNGGFNFSGNNPYKRVAPVFVPVSAIQIQSNAPKKCCIVNAFAHGFNGNTQNNEQDQILN